MEDREHLTLFFLPFFVVELIEAHSSSWDWGT